MKMNRKANRIPTNVQKLTRSIQIHIHAELKLQVGTSLLQPTVGVKTDTFLDTIANLLQFFNLIMIQNEKYYLYTSLVCS